MDSGDENVGLVSGPVFLRTKLVIPRSRSGEVQRTALLEKLNDIDSWRFAAVSAPAGFGKTTLIASWIRELVAGHPQYHFAWLTLDEHDNDPIRFWAYSIHAVRTQMPDACRGALRLLLSPQPPAMEVILTEMINELSLEVSQDKPGFLVLDDFQNVREPIIHEQLAFFMQNLPVDFHIIIGTRNDPPLPLPNWRAKRLLLEIGQDELRFSLNETTDFLNGTMNLTLDAETTEALAEKTEGWVAGLQLAALSMRERNDYSTFLKFFTGSHRHVLEYLSGEVLSRLPGHILEFVCCTSILERLSGSLCDSVTGRHDSGAILEWMEQNNLFISAIDEERVWYRYHNLFREMAQSRLKHTGSAEEIIGLHRRASVWLEANNELTDAIEHSLLIRDYENSARLIEYEIGSLLIRGYPGALAQIRALPEELIASRPLLCMAYAVSLLSNADFVMCHTWVDKAEKAFGMPADSPESESMTPENLHFLGLVDAIRSTLAVNLGNRSEVFGLARRALARLPKEERSIRCIVALNLGDAYSEHGEGNKAEEAYLEAIESGKDSGNLLIAVIAMASLGMLKASQGKLHEAYWTYQNALDTARLTGGQLLPVAGKAEVYMAQVLLRWNDLQAAEKLVRSGIEHCRKWGHQEHLTDGYQTLADIQLAGGKNEDASKTLSEAEQLVKLIVEKRKVRGIPVQHSQMARRIERIAEMKDRIANAQAKGGKVTPKPSDSMIEPLTERELDILRLLAKGRSNPEIAHELYLAVGTVKKHTNNIFGKLGVTSRTQALLKAKELNLI